MSSKWRAIQRRHKWTYEAMSLPPDTLNRLQNHPQHPLAAPFLQNLLRLAALQSTHSQLSAATALASSFLSLLAAGPPLDEVDFAVSAFSELLFAENSTPLHRILLSCLSQIPPSFEPLLQSAFRSHCCTYGFGYTTAATTTTTANKPSRRFALSAVASSLANLPRPGSVKTSIELCIPLMVESLSVAVSSLLSDIACGENPTPHVMDECQDAMSSLYYFLQRFPQKLLIPCLHSSPSGLEFEVGFLPPNSEHRLNPEKLQDSSMDIDSKVDSLPPNCEHRLNLEKLQDSSTGINSKVGSLPSYSEQKLSSNEEDTILNPSALLNTVYCKAVDTILYVLQSVNLSRDCIIAAGVGLCAALQLRADPQCLALTLANSIFVTSDKQSYVLVHEKGLESNGHSPHSTSLLEEVIMSSRGSSLAKEVRKFPKFSKLCLLRGLLTSIPRPVLNLELISFRSDSQEVQNQPWNLLVDGCLPAICAFCEDSCDSHFKFHSVTALQICMQQMKASISTYLDSSGSTQVLLLPSCIPEASVSRVLQIVWNNWEDPLMQTVKQIQIVFDLFIDMRLATKEKTGDGNNSFLEGIAKDLLSVGAHRKGRYVPLASLARRLGARSLLSIGPDLLFHTVEAMADDDVCCSGGSFLRSFSEKLREECWALEEKRGVNATQGDIAFRRMCIPPVLAGIISGNSRLRANLTTYALPVLLQIDSDGILPMLAFVLNGSHACELENVVDWTELEGACGLPLHLSVNQRVAGLISILKVGRSLALMEGDVHWFSKGKGGNNAKSSGDSELLAAVWMKGKRFVVPFNLLGLAVTHMEDTLRIDAAEVLCLNPKTACMPSSLELQLLRVAVPLNVRCSTTFFRMKWTSLFKKFFSHMRTAVERQRRKNGHLATLKDNIHSLSDNSGLPLMIEDEDAEMQSVSLQEMERFMQWFSCLLFFSLYPSAPYERKYMAMELFSAMADIWSISMKPENAKDPKGVCHYSPYDEGLFSKDATFVILSAVVDSWDRLRECAFNILMSYPNPLPGLETEVSIEGVLRWAKKLVGSPRVRESDAGALVLRLVFHKYVLELGWAIELHPSVKVIRTVGFAIGSYIESLNDWLEWGVCEGEEDLLRACKQSFVHGVLLAFRYTMEEIDWKCSFSHEEASLLRRSLARLLGLLLRVTSVALWVVSVDALSVKGTGSKSAALEEDESDCEDGQLEQFPEQDRGMEEEDFSYEEVNVLAPKEQVVMVGCWLAMKEVSLLLGTVTRKVPLSGSDNKETEAAATFMLDERQLEMVGEHFLQVLLSMKHNGAIDKTRAGFVALCNRLLCSNDSRLNKMPEIWLQQLMQHTIAKGQTVDDLLRRSAGIPAAFLALFLSEPEGAPKKLLPKAMRWLMDLVKDFLEKTQESTCFPSNNDKRSQGTMNHAEFLISETDTKRGLHFALKARDEGVVPAVHAFNAMRVTFHDTNLAVDASGFCAEAMIIAMRAFSSRYWEVRNAATLAFTALVHRTVGFLNVHKSESARRAITCYEFFHRYPTLHPFLLHELQTATLQLEGLIETSGNIGVLNKTLHPSLGPILIVLSRLKPSIINTGSEDWLSPAAFIAYVRRCATQSNFKVRMLASRALAPLVSSENLLTVLGQLAKELPESTSSLSHNTAHGVLLQMLALLQINCLNLPDSSKRKDIVEGFYPSVRNRSWLGNACSCPPVREAFLDVINGLVEVAKTCVLPENLIELRSYLAKLCAHSLDSSFSEMIGGVRGSAIVLLRAKSAELFFKAALPTKTDLGMILRRLKQCMFDSMYEVRLAVLKSLFQFLTLSVGSSKSEALMNSSNWIIPHIGPMVSECLKTEKHPRCVYRVLQLYLLLSTSEMTAVNATTSLTEELESLCSVNNTIQQEERESGLSRLCRSSEAEAWGCLLSLYLSAKRMKTREVALQCLGGCIQDLLKQKRDLIRDIHSVDEFLFVKDAIDTWVGLIKRHSVANEPVVLRRAVTRAVIASGLLKEASWVGPLCLRSSFTSEKDLRSSESANLAHYQEAGCRLNWFGQVVLDVWFVTLCLLEDEDAELRQMLSKAAFQSAAAASSLCMGFSSIASDSVPAQVERVFQLSFDYLTSQFGCWESYINALASWVLNQGDPSGLMLKDGDLVRRLFDKELDNHHEEALSFTQLCCLHLKRILQEQAGGGIQVEEDPTGITIRLQKFIHHWRNVFLKQAQACAESCVILQGHLQWVGGITNHRDGFKVLYPLLLGLLTLAHSSASSSVEELKAGLLELTKTMEPLLSNPLISSLFSSMLKSYEAELGCGLGSDTLQALKGSRNFAEFDPFFLVSH